MTKSQLILWVVGIVAAFSIGACVGVVWDPTASAVSDHDHDHEDHPDEDHEDHEAHEEEHEHDDHIALSEQAFANLNMKVGTVTLGDHVQTRMLPGELIEIPGLGNRAISAPVAGVVTDVCVRAGQAIDPADALFKMKIVDQRLSDSQVALLDLAGRAAVVKEELARLSPLAEGGVVEGRKKLELEYERRTLDAQVATRTQELLSRGFTRRQVEAIVNERRLITELTVCLHGREPGDLPSVVSRVADVPPRAASDEEAPRGEYVVESIDVDPGTAVTHGQKLCDVSYHDQLYVRGYAFQFDVETISNLHDRGWTVTVDFVHNHADEHQSGLSRGGLDVLYVDNHVDPKTQMFLFYIPLDNEIAYDRRDGHGRVFRRWRFKPGQRVHIRVPIETWSEQIRLPASAVVDEGLDVIVFREHVEEHDHDERHGGEEPDHEEHAFIEFEPVPVRVLHRDERQVVIANDGQLQLGERIALNNAYQLLLAMKAAGGGGHDHHHHH